MILWSINVSTCTTLDPVMFTKRVFLSILVLISPLNSSRASGTRPSTRYSNRRHVNDTISETSSTSTETFSRLSSRSTANKSSRRLPFDVPPLMSVFPQCQTVNDPLYLEAKRLIENDKLQDLISLLQTGYISDQPWATCLFATTIDSERYNALSYLDAYGVAAKTDYYDFEIDFMEWACKYRQWVPLKLFIASNPSVRTRIPLKDFQVLLFRNIRADLIEPTKIALEYGDYSPQEITHTLQLAAANNSKKVLRILIEYDRIPDRENVFGEFLLLDRGNIDLLLQCAFDLRFFSNEGLQELLNCACEKGFNRLTLAILQTRPTLFEDTRAWEYALKNGHFKLVKWFENMGFNVTDGKTFRAAVAEHNFQLARYLYASSSYPHIILTAQECVRKSDFVALGFILDGSTEIWARSSSKSLLDIAAECKNLDMIRYLIEVWNIEKEIDMNIFYANADAGIANYVSSLIAQKNF